MKRVIEKASHYEVHVNNTDGRFYLDIFLCNKLVNVVGACKTIDGCHGLFLKYAKRKHVRLWDRMKEKWFKWDEDKKQFTVCDDAEQCELGIPMDTDTLKLKP